MATKTQKQTKPVEPEQDEQREDEVEDPEESTSVMELEELLPDRPIIRFRTKEEAEEGKPATPYELRVPQEFGIEAENQFRAELGEYSELMNRRDLNSKERAKLVARMNGVFDKVLIAPAEIKKRFNDRQRQQVIALFTTALLTEDATAVDNAMPMAMQAIMARSQLQTMGS